jgi:hypothetical protein
VDRDECDSKPGYYARSESRNITRYLVRLGTCNMEICMDNHGLPLRASEIKMSNKIRLGRTRVGKIYKPELEKTVHTDTTEIREKTGEAFMIRQPTLVQIDM